MTIDFWLGVVAGLGLSLIVWWAADRARSR